MLSGRVLFVGMAATCLLAGCTESGPIIPPPGVNERPLSRDWVNPRIMHASTALADGRVLVVGGWGLRQSGTSVMLDEFRDAVIYDPGTDRWSTAGEMSRARLRHTATLM